MKVKTINAYALKAPIAEPFTSSRGWWYKAKTACLVEITTDEGVVGWGEALGPSAVIKTVVEDQLSPFVVGKDPMDTDVIWDTMYMRIEDYDPQGYGMAALSAIDIALWDIKGKIAGLPIYKLLGGAHRDHVHAYATGMFFKSETGDLITPTVEEAKRHVSNGFDAIKMKIALPRKEELRRVQAVRDAVGDDVSIMVDANHGYNLIDASWLAKGFEELNINWFEEPMPLHNISAYQELRKRTTIPLAGGEDVFGHYAFRNLIQNRALDIVQPDICCCGGITEAMKIAVMAEASGMRLYPHVFGSSVGFFSALQVMAAVPHVPHSWKAEELWMEFDQSANPFREELSIEIPAQKNNRVSIPDRPGIGVTVKKEAFTPYLIH